MDRNSKDPVEVTQALEVISNWSRALPSPLESEPAGYPPYGPSNRVEEGVRLRDVWAAIVKRRWLIAMIVLVITAATTLVLARRPDIYMAETDVQVDTESPVTGINSGKGNIIVDTGSDPSYFNTQLQIITKPGLLRRVVKTLDLEHNPDFLKAQANDTTTRRLLRTFGLVGAPSVTTGPAQKSDNDKLSIDKTVASATDPDDLEESTRLEPYVSALQGGLKVDPIKDERLQWSETRLISIKFTHANPVVAAKVANAVASAFVLSNLEQKTKFNSNTGDFLQQRIAELQNRIRADEERLINYAKGHEILSLDAAQNTVVDRLSGLNKQLLEAENDRKIAEAAFRVSKEPGAEDVLTKGQTKDLDAQLAGLKQKRAQLLVDNTEEWPEVKEVERQIGAVEKEIQDTRSRSAVTETETIEARYHAALDREKSLRAAFEEQRGATRTQNEAAINYNIIRQEIDTNKGLLDGLLQKAKENDVVLAGTPNNLHVTDYATAPRVPIGPNRLQGVVLAFLFALGFGVCLATMLEYLDDSIRSTEDISRVLRLPTLATIPVLKKGKNVRRITESTNGTTSLQLSNSNGNGNGHGNGNGNGNGHNRNGDVKTNPALLLDLDPRSPLAEAYRHLRTSVLLSTAGRAPKTLVVTSCEPAEGKTTTAINLAMTLAQTGVKVLVIDGDMRRPSVHDKFGAENIRGLSNVLSSEMAEAEVLNLVEHEAESGVYLMTAGPIPPNPAELVGSDRMRKVIEELSRTFDHVVIDSPPIGSFTDGVLLSAVSDGVILVIRANQCSRKIVQRAHQSLAEVGAKILGVVLNRVNIKTHGYYYDESYYSRYYNRESSPAERPTA